jgi:hypothetical protein
MRELIDLLHSGNYSCVIRNGDIVRTFTQRGVADLYALLKNEPQFLAGASVADKVIGRAAATLMLIGGVKEIYADTISEGALEILEGTDIVPTYTQRVPHIINRERSGWCPLERLTCGEQSSVKILEIIENFISR